MTTLSVNVNKLATLRNSRGKNNPDVLKTTLDIIQFGAQGITVHPRPDGRHIRTQDVYDIAQAIQVEFNIEGYPSQDFLALVTDVKPAQCTLVPDPPDVLTSNAGWNIGENFLQLRDVVDYLHGYGIRTSLFVDPYELTEKDIALLPQIGTDRVELYTEAYAEDYGTAKAEAILAKYQEIATMIDSVGIELNAGHDLSLKNLTHFVQAIPMIKEVSIGHALICDALYLGLEVTVQKYVQALNAT